MKSGDGNCVVLTWDMGLIKMGHITVIVVYYWWDKEQKYLSFLHFAIAILILRNNFKNYDQGWAGKKYILTQCLFYSNFQTTADLV